MRFPAIVAGAVTLMGLLAAPAYAEKRVALVIGNAAICHAATGQSQE